LTLESFDPASVAAKADLVFMALAHTQGIEPVRTLLDAGKRVIDLSADFRLRSAASYRKAYHATHTQPALLKRAVYGLTEMNRIEISRATLVANPGCYPTGALLPILPYQVAGEVDPAREIIIDAKSGVSGAGRTPTAPTHFPEIHNGMTAYQVGTHRHLPEIVQGLRSKAPVLFTPHLLPVSRGILTTIYLPLKRPLSQSRLEAILEETYAGEPFIRRCAEPPHLSSVRGANFCDIAVFASGRYAILISAIDNLVKGAAGQAIQNMNVMMGWDEKLGLTSPGIFP
jgi:N-acetyl-gamma-glutamyl-phosphate reductase